MRTHHIALSMLVFATSFSPAYANSQDDWATFSDIGAYGLTAVAIGLPLAKGDEHGALQAGGSYAAAQVTAFSLKRIFPETRPDGSDRKSFPSGHTASAFASAASIYKRQGPKIGIPALAVAGMVGVARVKADKHHWYDAVAGAGIGLAAGILITRKPDDRDVAIMPWGDTKSAGVNVAMRF